MLLYKYACSNTPFRWKATIYLAQALPDGRRPFSYSHLLFSPTLVRLPPGVPGEAGSEKTFEEELAAKGLVDPNEDLLPLKLLLKLPPKLLTLLLKRGLPNGEPVDP